jgi:inorganic pyrophosphatase
MVEIPREVVTNMNTTRNWVNYGSTGCFFQPSTIPVTNGFILDTLAEDGDALDALVLVWEPTFSGCVIEAKPVGLFKMWDENRPDEKILCVPCADPNWNYINNLTDVPPHLLKEIQHFFSIYKELEWKKTGIEGWHDLDSAIKVIRESQERFNRQDP